MLEHDGGLPDELRQLRDVVRRFMRDEVRPAEDQVEHDAFSLPPALLDPLVARAKQMGIWAYRSPVEYGGAGPRPAR